MNKQIKDKIINLFTRIPLFKSFSASEINEKFFGRGLAKIIEYDPDETIIAEGKYDDWVFWLIDGKIAVIKNSCRVATFERVGDMFGEMGILEGEARSASVCACIKTTCLSIDMSILDHPDLEKKISQESFCRDVAQVTKNRLANTTSRLTETERGLSITLQNLEASEKKRGEAEKSLKETLKKLDDKDRELKQLRQKIKETVLELESFRRAKADIKT